MAKPVLVDATGLVYRSFFGLPSLYRRGDAKAVHAVWGMARTTLQLLERFDYPAVLVLVFDRPWDPRSKQVSAGRWSEFPEYKKNRPAAPNELRHQFDIAQEVSRRMGLVTIVAPDGFGADDVLAHYAGDLGQACVVSSDKDMLQVVSATVDVYDPAKDVTMREADVEARLGVRPALVPDFLALTGDTSDNVPGVAGVGAKRAAALLRAHGTLEAVLAAAASDAVMGVGPKTREALRVQADAAWRARDLVQLRRVTSGLPSASALQRRRVETDEVCAYLRSVGLDAIAERFRSVSVRMASTCAAPTNLESLPG